MKYFVATLFLLVCFFAKAQECDPLDSNKFSLYKKHIKRYTKLINKQKYKKVDPIITYGIATYLRLSNDTNCNYWYRTIVPLCKYIYSGYDLQDKGLKTKLIAYIAMSYYYLKDYKNAELWLNKVVKCRFDACYLYILSLTQKQLGENEDADATLKQYNEMIKK